MKQVEREAIEAMEAAQREAEAARPGEAPKAQPGATEEESSEDAVKFDEKLDQPLLPKSEAAPAPAAPVDEDPEPPAVR